MSNWQLSEIRQKIRRITGRLTTREMDNNYLDNKINQFYQYIFPAELKLERAHTYYEFVTSANVYYKTYPSGYTNFEPPAQLDYQMIQWYQDPAIFQDQNPSLINSSVMATGDGATVAFATTANYIPIYPGTLIITDNTEIFQDTNIDWTTSTVNITGDMGGTATVNYETGAINVTFNAAPANGQDIYLSFVNFVAGRPTSVLAYNNRFTFYPPPDQSYRFKVKAYANNLVQTSAGVLQPFFENNTDLPLLDEWGPAICFGTAREINTDYGEMDAYAENTALYKEQLAYCTRRTNQNLLNIRSNPRF